jgi:hypothetical protein
MKSLLFRIALSCALVILGLSQSFAQCSDKDIRRNTRSGLESYVFETATSKAYNTFSEPRNTIDAAFTVFSGEEYRILNLCAGFGQDVEFAVFDTKKKQIFAGKGDQKIFDFTPSETGDYTVRFKFKEVANPNACVSFAVGYKL